MARSTNSQTAGGRRVSRTVVLNRPATIAETADYMRQHPRTVRRHIAKGLLPAYKIGDSRAIVVDLDDVDAILRPVPTAAS